MRKMYWPQLEFEKPIYFNFSEDDSGLDTVVKDEENT